MCMWPIKTTLHFYLYVAKPHALMLPICAQATCPKPGLNPHPQLHIEMPSLCINGCNAAWIYAFAVSLGVSVNDFPERQMLDPLLQHFTHQCMGSGMHCPRWSQSW